VWVEVGVVEVGLVGEVVEVVVEVVGAEMVPVTCTANKPEPEPELEAEAEEVEAEVDIERERAESRGL
jgi:hypothetical protein